MIVAEAVGRGLAVRRSSVGDDQHPRTGEARPPAEVEVFGTGERRGVEALELGEQVGAHQHHRGGNVEDVTHAVVLFLVDLARFDAGVRRPEAVDGPTHLEQHLGVLGAHELRAQDAGVRPVPLFHQEPHRGRIEHDVVVTQQEEGGTLDRVERLVGSVGEARAVREATDEGAREHLGDAGGGVVDRAAVDDEDREVVVVLLREAGERVLEPRTRVAGDHDGHDRRVLGQDLVGVPGFAVPGFDVRGPVERPVERLVGQLVEGCRRLVPGGRRDGSVGRFERAHEGRQRTVALPDARDAARGAARVERGGRRGSAGTLTP